MEHAQRAVIQRDQTRQIEIAYSISAIIQHKSSLRREHAQLVITFSGRMLPMLPGTAFKTIATPRKIKFMRAMELADNAMTTLTQVYIST